MTRPYTDRSLAIPPHAVQRFRERTGAFHLHEEECRRLIRAAVRRGPEREHWVRGQTVVMVDVYGLDVYAVIGVDETGWGDAGRAVTTILTRAQLDAGPAFKKRGLK